MKQLFILLLTSLLFVSCGKNYPPCTVQQQSDGSYLMVNEDCKGVQNITVLKVNGEKSVMTVEEAMKLVNENPAPSYAKVNSGGVGHNDMLTYFVMYHFLFNNSSPASHPGFYSNSRSHHYNSYRSNPKRYTQVKSSNTGVRGLAKVKKERAVKAKAEKVRKAKQAKINRVKRATKSSSSSYKSSRSSTRSSSFSRSRSFGGRRR